VWFVLNVLAPQHVRNSLLDYIEQKRHTCTCIIVFRMDASASYPKM